jgi:hypothetical protein
LPAQKNEKACTVRLGKDLGEKFAAVSRVVERVDAEPEKGRQERVEPYWLHRWRLVRFVMDERIAS